MSNPFYDRYVEIARAAARAFGVPEDLFVWQIGAESNWNPYAYNPSSGATGIAQFIPSTAQMFGLNPMNAEASLYAAAKYDAQLYKQHGSWLTTLQKYGTLGPSASQRTLSEGVPLAQAADAGAQGTSWWGRIFNATPGGMLFGAATGTGPASGLFTAQLWQRVGLVVLGMIVIAGAIYIFGSSQVREVVQRAAPK